VFQGLARQKAVIIEKWHLIPEHIHLCLSIPSKLAVSNVVGFIKGRTIARTFKGKQMDFNVETFLARGYFVSRVDLDENILREYNRNQEQQGVDRD
jgi:putative transposase